MKIISLGSSCQVKFNIERLHKPNISQFFDNVITDFKSVLYILQNINDKDLISNSNFTNKNVFLDRKTWTNCYKIEHTKFKMISLHDIRLTNKYIDSMEDFVLKYKRRLDRFKQLINSGEKIHMIYCLDYQFEESSTITKNDINMYKKYLCDINPNNNCFLHIVIPPKYSNTSFHNLIEDGIYVYYLCDSHKGEGEEWTNTNFNWEIIFDNINKINI